MSDMSERQLMVDRRAVQQTSNSVFGMLLFVISEAMFFMGFIAVYFSSYASHTVWPPKQIPIPAIGLPTVSVLALVVSIGSMAMANRSSRSRDPQVVRWLLLSLGLALAFVILLVVSLRGVGFGPGTDIYGSLFWALTVIELAHAVGGIVFFLLILVQASAGELVLRQDPVQAAAIYWYFVVAIGVGMYVIFYMANIGAT